MKTLDELLRAGTEYLGKSEFDKAEEVFQKALEIEPESSVCYNNLGMLRLFNKDVEAAIPLLEKALQLDPKILEAYQNLGSCYLFTGENEKAEEMYLKSLQIDPDNFSTYHNLSTMYLQTQQYSKAKKTLEKLLHMDGDNYHASFMLGIIFLTLKEYYPAIANFLYTLRIKEDYHNARIALADALYRFGRLKAAVKELDYLIKELPDLVTPYIKKSLILIEAGEHAEALPLLEEARKLEASNPEVLEILAILYEEFGEKEKAEEVYQEILIIDPEHKSASEGLERLETIAQQINAGGTLFNNNMFS